MCGIAGIFDLEGKREIDLHALRRMGAALTHRGPDGEGFFSAPGIGLAHRRLAIIDVEGGAQPFHTDSGVLKFNGEIYNYQSLAKDLIDQGVRLQTRSDTEVLACGLGRRGADFVQQLRGVFAFAFWDADARQLLLARDRLGEKPLYYTQTADGFFVFASELPALIASGLVSRQLREDAIADYFFYGYVPDPKTIYQGIFKLPPAHLLRISASGVQPPKRYWRPVFAPTANLKFADACAMLQSKIDDAVSTQMIADVPLGAFLSGGIDSAGIVASMAETGDEIVACTIGFNEASHDERDGARQIAARYGVLHHEKTTSLNAAGLVDEVASGFGEPFADSSAIASYAVSALARQHVTVALSGDGGDEVFAGYRRYPFYLAEEKLRALAPLFARRAIFGPAAMLYPKLDWAPRPLRAKTTLQALAASSSDAYANATAINLPAHARALLSPDLRQQLGDYRPHNVIEKIMRDADCTDPLFAAQHTDLMTWLPGRMLAKIDRTSMAHGLEVRPPLLDHKLVEWSGLLPAQFKINNGARKHILKQTLRTRLGDDYVSRPKRGFDIPVSQWFRTKESPLLERLQSGTLWRESGLICVPAVERLVERHLSGAGDCGQALWSVLMFDAFLRTEQSRHARD